jgi:hypothetical protein
MSSNTVDDWEVAGVKKSAPKRRMSVKPIKVDSRPSSDRTSSNDSWKKSQQAGILNVKTNKNNVNLPILTKQNVQPKKKKTNSVTLFDFILSNKNQKTHSSSVPSNDHMKLAVVEEVKLKSFIANKKKKKKGISTLKKRLLLVCVFCFLYSNLTFIF